MAKTKTGAAGTTTTKKRGPVKKKGLFRQIMWIPAVIGLIAGRLGLELIFEFPLIGDYLRKLFMKKAKATLFLIAAVGFAIGRSLVLDAAGDKELGWLIIGASVAPLMALGEAKSKGVAGLAKELGMVTDDDALGALDEINQGLAGAWERASEEDRERFIREIRPVMAGVLQGGDNARGPAPVLRGEAVRDALAPYRASLSKVADGQQYLTVGDLLDKRKAA